MAAQLLILIAISATPAHAISFFIVFIGGFVELWHSEDYDRSESSPYKTDHQLGFVNALSGFR